MQPCQTNSAIETPAHHYVMLQQTAAVQSRHFGLDWSTILHLSGIYLA